MASNSEKTEQQHVNVENEREEGGNKNTDNKTAVTVNEKPAASSEGETLPGWTIMRPLRMRGLKGKASSATASTSKKGGEGHISKDSRDLKTMATNDSADADIIGEVEALHDVRSDDELLEGGSGARRNIAGQVNGDDLESSSTTQVYKVYKRRWFGLVQLVLLNIVVSWDWLTFSASSTTASQYYKVSPTAINWLSTAFLFAFVFISPVVLFVLHRGGPKPSIVVASILLLLGNWIRYGCTKAGSQGNFGGVVFGQILTGVAQPFVLAAPTRYSDLWFSNRGRVAATAVMSLANPFGGALAQLIGPMLADKPNEIPNMVLVIAIIATIASIPSFFIPASPPTPVSASGTVPKQELLPSLKWLFASPEFYMILIPFTFYVGLFNSLSSLINQFLQPYSFSETDAGIAGALLIVVGLVSAAVISPIIDRKKTYLLAIKIQVPVIALCYLAFTFAPQTRSSGAPYVILAILGAASFSLMPVVLEYLIEVSHPVSPEVTSTICWTGGQLLGGIFIIASGALRTSGASDGSQDDGSDRPPGNMYNALILQTVLAMIVVPIPLCLGLFGRSHGVVLRRVESDKSAAERRSVATAEGVVLP